MRERERVFEVKSEGATSPPPQIHVDERNEQIDNILCF